MDNLIDQVLGVLEDANRGRPPFRWFIYAGTPRKVTKRFVLVVDDATDQRWFAKLAPAGDPRFGREFEACQELLEADLDSAIMQAIPRVVMGTNRICLQEWVTGMQYKGIIIRDRFRPWRRDRLLYLGCKTIRWLVGFHRAGMLQPARAYQHGDFKPSNVLFDGTAEMPRVVDWEWFSSTGESIHDLFHFVTYWGLACSASVERQGMERTFLDSNWVSKGIRELIATYAEGIGYEALDHTPAFMGYLDATLARRRVLGLSNEGCFLVRLRSLIRDHGQSRYALSL